MEPLRRVLPSRAVSTHTPGTRAGALLAIVLLLGAPRMALSEGAAAGSAEGPSATSPDGRTRVFVRVDATRTVATAQGDLPHEDLWIATGGKERLLLAGREAPPDAGVEQTLTDFDGFAFSPDGSSLYFTSAAWVTSPALHVVDLRTGEERFLVDGALERVIATGPYAGMLLAVHFRLDDAHPIESEEYRGRIETHSILSSDGKTVQRLPEDEGAWAAILKESPSASKDKPGR